MSLGDTQWAVSDAVAANTEAWTQVNYEVSMLSNSWYQIACRTSRFHGPLKPSFILDGAL